MMQINAVTETTVNQLAAIQGRDPSIEIRVQISSALWEIGAVGLAAPPYSTSCPM